MPKSPLTLFTTSALYVEPRSVHFDAMHAFVGYYMGTNREQEMLSRIDAQRHLLGHLVGQGTLQRWGDPNDQSYHDVTFKALYNLRYSVLMYKLYTAAVKTTGVMHHLHRQLLKAREDKKFLIIIDDPDIRPILKLKLRSLNPIDLTLNGSKESIDFFKKSHDSRVMIASSSNLCDDQTDLTSLSFINKIIVLDHEWTMPYGELYKMFLCIHNTKQKRRVYCEYVTLKDCPVDQKIMSLYQHHLTLSLNNHHKYMAGIDSSYSSKSRFRSPNGVRVPRKNS